MFAVNDMLQLTSGGVEKYSNQFNADDKFFVSKVIQETKEFVQYVVITNLSLMKRKKEPQKPILLTLKKAHTFFKHLLDEDDCGCIYLYEEHFSLSDEQLEIKHPNWLIKRNRQWTAVEQLISDDNIFSYLRGELGQLVLKHAARLSVNEKVIRRALNRCTSLGCRKNALLPIGYANVGKSERKYTKKPGPKTILLPEHTSRMVKPSDINKVKRVALQNRVDIKDGKFCLKKLHRLFLKKYCCIEKIVRKGDQKHFELVIDDSRMINYQQFKRLFHKAFTQPEQEVLKVGKSAFQNNRKDKAGNATEGVMYAAQQCESDSTELPIYVAYPLNREKREAAGKVNLCIVVCVKTQLVMGYSLNFGAPQWMSVAEALINCVQDKQEYAKQYGTTIESEEWPSQHFPQSLRVDNGGENTPKQFLSVLQEGIGISNVDYCPPGNGAAKGTVENLLRIIQDFIPNIPGSVEKGRDAGIQHPSQRAIFQSEDIHRLLIRVICIHNSLNARERLLTVEMAMNEVIQTPSAMWSYLMNDELYSRPKMSQKRLPELIFAIMPKIKAKVERTQVKLNELGYYSQWAEDNGWFLKASQSRFSIDVISLGGSVDNIYYKDETGELQPFFLKKEYEQYRGMTAEQAKFRRDEIKKQGAKLGYEKENAMLNFEHEVEQLLDYRIKNDFKDAPINTQKTIQGGIAERKAIMIEDERRLKAEKLLNTMKVDSVNKVINEEQIDEDDYEDIY